MQAQMVTGLFRFEACEMQLKDKVVYVSFPEEERTIRIASIIGVSLNRTGNDTRRMIFITERGQYEFLFSGQEAGEEAVAMVFELTKDNVRLELRTQ